MAEPIKADLVGIMARGRHSQACDGGSSIVGLPSAEAAMLALTDAGFVVIAADALEALTARNAELERASSRAFPAELTDDLRDVLSTMLWTCGPIAVALRAGGAEIKHKAEDEQAYVLHWLITLALEHGPGWLAKGAERISTIRAALSPAQEGGE